MLWNGVRRAGQLSQIFLSVIWPSCLSLSLPPPLLLLLQDLFVLNEQQHATYAISTENLSLSLSLGQMGSYQLMLNTENAPV